MAVKNRRKEQNRIYTVTIEGQYFKVSNGATDFAPYRETMRMSEEHRQAGPLYVFKNMMADRIMKKKYEGYTGLYTHHLVSMRDESDPNTVPNDPTLMNVDELMAFIEHNNLPVETALYQDGDSLRQAVIDCLEDGDAFEDQQDHLKRNRGNEIELSRSLASLNPEDGALEQGDASRVTDEIPDADDVVLPSDKVPSKRKVPTDRFTEDDFKPKKNKGGRPRKEAQVETDDNDDDDEFDV